MPTATPLKFFKAGERMAPQDVLAKLKEGDTSQQRENAIALLHDARTTGFGIDALLHSHVQGSNGLNGFQAVFQAANVPLNLKDNTAIAAFAASTTAFTTNDGLKVLLPSIVNTLLRNIDNKNIIESADDLIVQTRMVKGNELQKEIQFDRATKDSYRTSRIAEGANIPTRRLVASQSAVQFYKTGHGIEVSYEVAQSMTPDLLVPYASRIEFERKQSEHAIAVQTLINGESLDPASANGGVKQDNLDLLDGKTNTPLRQRVEGIIRWLVNSVREGRPIDTLVVSWDTMLELQFMFALSDANGNEAKGLAAALNGGGNFAQMSVNLARGFNLNVTVIPSSSLEEKQILGFRKAETIERLIKADSQIAEQEKTIRNQMILYTNTIISGFTLAYGDSRRLLSWT